jgi:hypothetical protein
VPTPAIFLAAADAFGATAHDVSTLLPPVDALVTPRVLEGGLLTTQVTAALHSCTSVMTVVAQACRDAAAECRWRAAVCELHHEHVAVWDAALTDYQQASRQWQVRFEEHRASAATPDPGPPPRPPGAAPAKPFTWVD